MAELVNERYKITTGWNAEDVTIFVEINNNDQVTIQSNSGHPNFQFNNSNPDRVMAMGMALQEAAELVGQRKVMAG